MPIPAATVLLSEADLLETYDEERNPKETVEQYRRAHELREKDSNRSRASIAREVGRPSSTLRRWLVDDAKPSEIKAIETAEQYDWLPLHSDDRVFEGINQLIAWVYAGGWINPDTFQPSITINHRLHYAIARHVIDPLGNEWRSIREDDTEQTQELRPRDGGAVLGRLLHALGTPRGRKADQSITLPSYLDRIDAYHRRQFARMYLLHRGSPANAEGVGLTIQETRSKSYFQELQALFEAVTDEPISLNELIPKLFLSTAAVQALAGDTTDPKPALAYRLAYGDDETLVSKRAFVNTYESSSRNPWTVVQQYREAMRRIEDVEVTNAQLARDIGVSYAKLRSWTEGGKPYSVNGLEKAKQRGWVGIEPSGKTFLSLNRLVAWLFSAGYLSASNMHPRFLFGSETHRRVLEGILETLDIDAKIQKSGTSPEVHPRTDGAILGRTLRVMGVPLAESTKSPLLSLPVYLHALSEQLRQDFATVYLLNRGRQEEAKTAGLTVSQPKYPSQYLDDLHAFLDELGDGAVSRDENTITLSTEAVHSFVPGFNEADPKESIATALGF